MNLNLGARLYTNAMIKLIPLISDTPKYVLKPQNLKFWGISKLTFITINLLIIRNIYNVKNNTNIDNSSSCPIIFELI